MRFLFIDQTSFSNETKHFHNLQTQQSISHEQENSNMCNSTKSNTPLTPRNPNTRSESSSIRSIFQTTPHQSRINHKTMLTCPPPPLRTQQCFAYFGQQDSFLSRSNDEDDCRRKTKKLRTASSAMPIITPPLFIDDADSDDNNDGDGFFLLSPGTTRSSTTLNSNISIGETRRILLKPRASQNLQLE